MKISKKRVTIIPLLLLSMLATGCAQNPYGNSYNVNEARQMQEVSEGVVVNLNAVTMNSNGESMIGTIAGGAIGAILGSKIGGGTGSEIASIGGGLAGAALGNSTGNAISTRQGVNITIKTNSGRTIAVVQQVDPNMIFHVGQKVYLYQQGSTTRVMPAQ